MEQKTYALGQRYIGAGQSEGTIILNEVPGNALGAYLDGANIIVNCSAQDATGDTMNAGEITIHGSTGDASSVFRNVTLRTTTACAAVPSTCRAMPVTAQVST